MTVAPDLAMRSPSEAWRTTHAAPGLELAPLTSRELDAWFRGGEPEADACEELLAWAARARGALDVAIAEGLTALRQGDRLAELGCHLDDYGREVLDLGKRATEELARLGRGLRTRPLLREALRSGRVRLRAAQTVLNVAMGEAEAEWVERAVRVTVRELEAEVRRAGKAPGEENELWLRLGVHLRPEERAVADEALALAGEIIPGASRAERLEAVAQEFAGEYPACEVEPAPSCAAPHPGALIATRGEGDEDALRPLRGALRPVVAGSGNQSAIIRSREAWLEAETERWAALPGVADLPAPDVRFYETATAQDVDARLRELAALRAEWEELVGYCALAVRKSRMYQLLGFASFRQYCHERLGLSARAVEERAKVEERRWASPALQEAKRRGLPFEKLRLLSRLPEGEIAAWTPRAHALTCIALRRELEVEAEWQMRAQRKLTLPLPRRVAAVLAAAVAAARERTGMPLSLGTCLAVIARHFIDTWRGAVKRTRSRSRKVRDRDDGHCRVPGCSHLATHAHHVLFRSHGGGDEAENQVGLCAFHHLRCVHGGHLRVVGRAPDGLKWFLRGRPWEGPRADAR